MIVNKTLMAKARFEKKQISELTVKEFRQLMQDCFDADRAEIKRREHEAEMRLHAMYGPQIGGVCR